MVSTKGHSCVPVLHMLTLQHMEHVITRDEVMEIERILEGSGDGEMAKMMAVLDPVQHHEDEEIEDEMGEIEDEDM